MAKRPSAKASSEANKVKAANNAYYKALSARDSPLQTTPPLAHKHPGPRLLGGVCS